MSLGKCRVDVSTSLSCKCLYLTVVTVVFISRPSKCLEMTVFYKSLAKRHVDRSTSTYVYIYMYLHVDVCGCRCV